MSDRATHIQATDDAIAAFLAAGGVIQSIPPGKSGIPDGYTQSAWGRPKRKAAEVTPPIDDLSESSIDPNLDDMLVDELVGAAELDKDLFAGIIVDDLVEVDDDGELIIDDGSDDGSDGDIEE